MKSVNRVKRQIFKSGGASGQGVMSFWAKKEDRFNIHGSVHRNNILLYKS